MANYQLQILHASDLEGGVDAIANAPNFAAIIDAFEEDFANSVLLSAGDNYIPGPFYSTAADFSMGGTLTAAYERFYEEVLGAEVAEGQLDLGRGGGRVDVSIMNIMGFDASAVGNHEFDNGTGAFADIIESELDEGAVGWTGAMFPYLSANLDFSGDGALGGLYTDEIVDAASYNESLADLLAGTNNPDIASATIIEENGERIGVIGATTQRVESISSTGGVEEATGGVNDMDALAAAIQPQIDALTAQGVNKIVLTTHLQQIALEKELAGKLSGVDVIIAGGSDTLLADDTDTLREGDEAAEGYPFLTQDADGKDVAIVSTDGEYSYVGRLVVEFDENGDLIADSIDAAVSGAYATDESGVLAVTGAATVEDAVNGSTRADIVEDLTSAVQVIVDEKDAIEYGQTDVFLEGRRSAVRTEETNLGNLTADANLAAARAVDDAVTIAFKNGGGIRAAIGEVEEVADGVYEPSEGDGVVSQLDLENALRFNNRLAVVDLTPEGLKQILEHAVAQSGDGATPGRFPQIAGLRFSYDEDAQAQAIETDESGDYVTDADGALSIATQGERVKSIALVDPATGDETILFSDGAFAEDAPETVRMTTLNFLAGGGDGYPFPELAQGDIRFVTTEGGLTTDGDADNLLGEQAALAQFMETNFPVGGDDAFDASETSAAGDRRIVNISEAGQDAIAKAIPTGEATLTEAARMDSEVGEGGSEVAAHEDGKVFVTNGAEDRIDIFDAATGEKSGEIDLSGIADYDGVQSVAVKNGVVAAAVARTADGPLNGVVAFFDVDGAALGEVVVGNLPDMLTFTPDGSRILVANEGEPTEDGDPMGGVSIIDISGGVASATVQTLDFTAFDGQEDALREAGVRIFPDRAASVDLEPEYIAVSPDGSTAYVALQEANAYATVDLAAGAITDITSFGLSDHSVDGGGLDPNDRDGAIDIAPRTVKGIRMPDAIAAFDMDGETYLITANEGDDRGDFDEGGEAARVGDILDGDVEGVSIDASVDTTGLERLTVSTIDGGSMVDTDDDGEADEYRITELHAYGARSFSILNAETGDVLFDSGDWLAQIAAQFNTEFFNDDDEEGNEDRSDNKGVEPEAVAVGVINGDTYAFVGMERDGGIAVFNISDPSSPSFATYINAARDGDDTPDVSPETLSFIAAEDSASGAPQLLASYEISGSTALYDLSTLADATDGDDAVEGGAGDNVLDAMAGDDVVTPGAGADMITLGAGADTLRDTTANLNGDTVMDFAMEDRIVFTDARFDGGAVSFEGGALGVPGGALTLQGFDASGGDFMAAGDGAGGTQLTFHEHLIDLTPGVAVDAANVNGIDNAAYLSGDNASRFGVTVEANGFAAFTNAIGVYEVDNATGAIDDVRILIENVKTASGVAEVDNVDAGKTLGFFLIQNGAGIAASLAGSDTLSFIDNGDGAMVLANGGAEVSGATTFLSHDASLNIDGVQHALSGVSDDGEGALRIGFEDLTGGGDRDYEDVVLYVDALDLV